MKKITLFVLGLILTSATAVARDYPDDSRFKQYNVRGTSGYIIKDTKTGCEYLFAEYSGMVLVAGSCNPDVKTQQ